MTYSLIDSYPGTLERPSKRLHGSTPLNTEGESKRMRCTEPAPISPISKTAVVSERLEGDKSIIIGATANITNGKRLRVDNDELMTDVHNGQTLLLQQLMADRDMSNKIKSAFVMGHRGTETSDRHNNDPDEGEDEQRKRQSHSVLKNLLVSGCDVSAGYVCLVKPKSISKGITSK